MKNSKNRKTASNMIAQMARQSLRSSRMRNNFVLITIVLASALLMAILMFAMGQKQQVKEELSHRQQVSYYNLTEAQLAALAKDDRISCQIQVKTGVLSEMDGFSVMPCYVSELSDDIRVAELESGRLPETEDEIAAQAALLRNMGVSPTPGSTVTFSFYDGTTETFTLSGILKGGETAKQFSVLLSKDYAEKGSQLKDIPYEVYAKLYNATHLLAEECREAMYLIGSDAGIERKYVAPSKAFLDTLSPDFQSMMLYGLVGAAILLACILVIYGVFYLSVIGRIHQFGQLRTIGMTRRQIARFVSREGSLLFLRSAPVGILIGGIAGYCMVPAGFSLANTFLAVLLVFAVIYVITMISVRKPARLAGAVSPMEALRYLPQDEMPRRKKSGNPAAPRKLCRRLTPFALGRMNFSRNRKKAFVTALSLSLTGILLLCISAYANSVDIEEMAQSQFGDRSQYLLQYEDYAGREFYEMQKENPLGEALREELAAIPNVDFITAYSTACVEIPAISEIPGNREHEAFIVRGIDQENMDKMYTGDTVLEGKADYRQLVDGDGILVCPSGSSLKEIYKTIYQVGDTVTFSCYNGQAKTYTVMGIVKDIPICSSAHYFILPEGELSVLYPEISDFTSYVNIHTREDSKELRKAVFGAVSDERVAISGLEDTITVLESGMQGELKRDYSLLIFIFVFSLINLANTLITNLLARQQEFGVLQSVGMSERQMSKMLSYECLYYIGITLLVTLTVGTVCSLALCYVFDQVGMFGKLTYHFPVLQVLVFAAALLLVQAVFSVCAVRYTRRLSLVERIKATE